MADPLARHASRSRWSRSPTSARLAGTLFLRVLLLLFAVLLALPAAEYVELPELAEVAVGEAAADDDEVSRVLLDDNRAPVSGAVAAHSEDLAPPTHPGALLFRPPRSAFV